MITTEFISLQNWAESFIQLFFMEKLLNTGEFFRDGEDFTGAFDGGIFIVGAIMKEGFISVNYPARTCECFKIETSILIRRARSREKINSLFYEEFTTIDGGPNGGGLVKNMLVLSGVD